MILQAVFDLVKNVIKLVFGWINLPDMPEAVTSVVDELFALLRGSVGMMGDIFRLENVENPVASAADRD